ncbi:hypothetical protein [Streptomyces harbinensis]|uniref:hypothetical protein n=1 Tax=Streptomyces harbinensis TaxID=1176198 RepID=UPI0034DFF678
MAAPYIEPGTGRGDDDGPARPVPVSPGGRPRVPESEQQRRWRDLLRRLRETNARSVLHLRFLSGDQGLPGAGGGYASSTSSRA